MMVEMKAVFVGKLLGFTSSFKTTEFVSLDRDGSVDRLPLIEMSAYTAHWFGMTAKDLLPFKQQHNLPDRFVLTIPANLGSYTWALFYDSNPRSGAAVVKGIKLYASRYHLPALNKRKYPLAYRGK